MNSAAAADLGPALRIVQFEIPGSGRRIGVVQGETVRDLTSVRPQLTHVVEAARTAHRENCLLAELLSELAADEAATELNYGELLAARPGAAEPFLHPPVDDPDPHRVLVTGTGLTHTGSMQSRNAMHGGTATGEDQPAAEPETDSARMFQIGLDGGRPEAGQRGAAPEWFYKGNGEILRGPNGPLELPAFALDGGEEPELVGCYLIDFAGQPRRVGFTMGNEWSDHATERINYLYLAPSKLRTCSMGPELITGFEFESLELRCVVEREGAAIYDSGPLKTGQQFMSHSLANCEDHHFKYPQHRQPGDIHLHYFGTSQLSYSTRSWKFSAGDVIRIESPGFSAPLVNPVVAGDSSLSAPVTVHPG